MSVYKPKKSPRYHYDFVWKGVRYTGATGCSSKRDAQRFEDNRRREIALGIEAKPVLTVAEACGQWQEQVGSNLASKATTLYQLGYLIAGLGANTPFHDLTFRQVQDYTARRRGMKTTRGTLVSRSSVNREIQLLRRVVRWAEPRGYDVPSIDWGKLQFAEPKQRIRELSEDEEARLIDKLPENLRPLVRFALLSGQRRTEIITLRWADVDLIGMRATTTVKGGHRHTFPLSPAMAAIIKEQPKVCAQVFTYVCQRRAPARKDRVYREVGQRYPFSAQGWARQWRKAVKDAGIEDYRFHDNRHTAATRNLRNGGSLVSVSKLLGHENISTTSRYAHASEDDVRAMLLATETGQNAKVGKVQNRRAKSA